MDKSYIRSRKEENILGNRILLFILVAALVFMIFQLFTSFNDEPYGDWHFYFSIIGYAWGIIFISVFLYFTIRNLL